MVRHFILFVLQFSEDQEWYSLNFLQSDRDILHAKAWHKPKLVTSHQIFSNVTAPPTGYFPALP